MVTVKRIFYLGAHHPDWLSKARVPLFISRNRLVKRRTFPRAACRWALDSGGFTELSVHGRWTVSTVAYIREARLFIQEIGRPDFVAPQDWMCEPWIIQKTGLSVAEHQLRTLRNFLELRTLAPDLPWIPVLQGWAVTDYWRHVEMYEGAGVDLARLPLVGVGSVCRRQATASAGGIVSSLTTAYKLKLHGFGFKKDGLRRYSPHLVSADSMAWSRAARHANGALPGCSHARCNNCIRFAQLWRSELPDAWL